MLWNVFSPVDGEMIKINEEPYDAEQVGMLLEQLDEQSTVVIVGVVE